MRRPDALLVGCLLLVAACEGPTPYVPRDASSFFKQPGYRELELSQDSYRVSYRCGQYTPADRIADFTLLRCADLTQEQGFRYFVVEDVSDQTEWIPGGCVGLGSEGGYSVIVYTVQLLRENPVDRLAVAYDAAVLERELRARYSLPPRSP